MATKKKKRKVAGGNRFDLSEELWRRLEVLLPRKKRTEAQRRKGGRPPVSDRDCARGIFFVLRTGCQWNALNATGICSSSSAHRRFQQWVQAGVFRRLWQRSLEEFEELVGLDWKWQAMDGSMVKSPPGSRVQRGQPHRPGQARGQTQPAGGGPRRAGGTGLGGSQPP
jgi:putative transposase